MLSPLDGPIFAVGADGKLQSPEGGLIQGLFRLGRLGGAISLAIGLAAMWATFRSLETVGGVMFIVPAMGVGLSLLGLVLLIFGNGNRRKLRPVRAQVLDAGLSHRVETQSRPYVFCTACRDTTDEMHCHRCASQQHTMKVESDADQQLLIAVLEAS